MTPLKNNEKVFVYHLLSYMATSARAAGISQLRAAELLAILQNEEVARKQFPELANKLKEEDDA